MLAAIIRALANPSELACVSEFRFHLLKLRMLSLKRLSACLTYALEGSSLYRLSSAPVSLRRRQDTNALRYNNGSVCVC